MQIKNHVRYWSHESGSKHRISGRTHWEGAFLGSLVLVSVFVLMLLPFGGRSAAPGLVLGPFTNISGADYVLLTVTNGGSTNTYQIDRKADLRVEIPWV